MWLLLSPLLLVAQASQTITIPPPDYLLELPTPTIVPSSPLFWPGMPGKINGNAQLGAGYQGDQLAQRAGVTGGGPLTKDTALRADYAVDLVESPAVHTQEHALSLDIHHGRRPAPHLAAELGLSAGSVTLEDDPYRYGAAHAAAAWSGRYDKATRSTPGIARSQLLSADVGSLAGDQRAHVAVSTGEQIVWGYRRGHPWSSARVGLGADLRTWVPGEGGQDPAQLLVIALDEENELIMEQTRWLLGVRAALRSDTKAPLSPILTVQRRLKDGKGMLGLGAARVWDDTAIVPSREDKGWVALGGDITDGLDVQGGLNVYARQMPLSAPAALVSLDEIRDAPTLKLRGAEAHAKVAINLHGVPTIKLAWSHRWVGGGLDEAPLTEAPLDEAPLDEALLDEALLDPAAPWTPGLLDATRRDQLSVKVATSFKQRHGNLLVEVTADLASAAATDGDAWWLQPTAEAGLLLRKALGVHNALVHVDLSPSLAFNVPDHSLLPELALVNEVVSPADLSPLLIRANITVYPRYQAGRRAKASRG